MPVTRSTYHQKEKTINGKRMVLKRSYTKKGYTRRAYTRRTPSGKVVHVKASRIRPTKIKSTWILKQGLTHGKYGLIPLKDPLARHFGEFGYKLSKSSTARHAALKKAISKYGRNWAVRRLTALANVRPLRTKYASAVRKLRSDVHYIQHIMPSKTSLKRKTGGVHYAPTAHKKTEPEGKHKSKKCEN